MCSELNNLQNFSSAKNSVDVIPDEEFKLNDWYGYADKWHPDPYFYDAVFSPGTLIPNHHKPWHDGGPPWSIPEPTKIFYLAMFALCVILRRRR